MEHSFGVYYLEAEMSDLFIAMEEEGLDVEKAKEDFSSKNVDKALDRCDVVAAEEADNEFLDELEKFIERRDDNDSGLSLDLPAEPSEKKDEDDEIYF